VSDFKDDREHTLEEAIRVLKRLHRISAPHGYSPSICGSTVLKGKGRDIDVHIVGAPSRHVISPLDLAMKIVKKHARHIYLWHTEETDGCMDVVVVWESHDRLYIDMHIVGLVK
jgi:hypothetical protein